MSVSLKASSDGTQAILQVGGVDKVVIGPTGIISGIPQATVDPLIATKLNASGSAPMYACRAWVNFNGTGTVAIRASGNVSSITDRGVGLYTVNITTAMPDENYAAVCTGTGEGSTSNGLKIDQATPLKTTTAINIVHMGGNYSDLTQGNVAIFR